jgi:PEP-CTERM motif
MSTSLKLLAMASVAMLGIPEVGYAETINFSQFGSSFSFVASPTSGVTSAGNPVTVTGPLPGAHGFLRLDEGISFIGLFPQGAPLLFDSTTPGSINLSFPTPITSLTLAAQANNTGPYTETMTAYSGVTVLGSVTASAVNCGGTATCEISNCGSASCQVGTVPFLTLSYADITSIVIGTTNDSIGIALDGSPPTAVPEPASMTLLGAGALGLGTIRRKRLRNLFRRKRER